VNSRREKTRVTSRTPAVAGYESILADVAELLKMLGRDLTSRFGRGFSWRNLCQMRKFYLAYAKILQTSSANSLSRIPAELSRAFPLPWSQYVRLLSLSSEDARAFYETEALRAHGIETEGMNSIPPADREKGMFPGRSKGPGSTLGITRLA
jgi:hypothetical protein